jgi:Transposase DDE domain
MPAVARTLEKKDIRCLKHLRRVFTFLDDLKDVGCQRDRAGNRTFFFDHYVKLVLLHFMNPALGSIADLQQAAELPNVAKALGISHFSAGSFSESVRVFDDRKLDVIVTELSSQLQSRTPDKRLKDLEHTLTLVDGTLIRGLQRLTRAAAGLDGRYNTTRDGVAVYGWRLHTQLDLATFAPRSIVRTGARNAGSQRENNVLRNNLEPGRCYIGDGGYADRSLFDDIVDADSSYVIRGKENDVFTVTRQRALSEQDQAASVVSDAMVAFENPTRHPVRRIELKVQPHPRRKRNGVKQSDRLILYTCLLELPAELIALIYRFRYGIELYFRIVKELIGMRRLISQRAEGIDIQVYCAVIVCLLLQLIGDARPNKRVRSLLSWHLLGLASEQDVIDHLNRPDNRGVKLRAKADAWKKLGF